MSRVDRIAFIGDRQSDVHLLVADAGVKAVKLGRLDRLGLPVPPALVIDSAVSQEFMATGALPRGFAVHLAESMRLLEHATGLRLGGRQPLLLSVRSSPVVTMPGMLGTLLNVGLTEEGVHYLIGRTGNPWLGWDCYRRFVRAFGEAVHHIEPAVFDRMTATHVSNAHASTLQDLDSMEMRDLARESARLRPLPEHPIDQILRAVEAVLASWDAPHAREYRRICGIDDNAGTAVLVQAMVFGNGGTGSGSGVGFTRNPDTGDNDMYFDFVFNAQGDDVVSGRGQVRDSALLPRVLPRAWAELQRARPVLEREFLDMQEIEFTIENGRLFFLQTRDGKATPWAAVRIAVDLVQSGVIDMPTALKRLAAYDLNAVVRRTVSPASAGQPIAHAVAAGPGVATGSVAFDVTRARQLAASRPVVLVRPEIGAGDLAGIEAAAGVLAGSGARTSHAAVVARQLGKACLVGCADLRVDRALPVCTLGSYVLHEGDVITLDGASGLIYAGGADVVVERPDAALAVVESWRRQTSQPARVSR